MVTAGRRAASGSGTGATLATAPVARTAEGGPTDTPHTIRVAGEDWTAGELAEVIGAALAVVASSTIDGGLRHDPAAGPLRTTVHGPTLFRLVEALSAPHDRREPFDPALAGVDPWDLFAAPPFDPRSLAAD